MKEKNRQRRLRLVAEAKKKPAVFTVYIILRLIVVAILVSSILRGEYENVGDLPAGAVFVPAAAVCCRKTSASSCRARWRSSFWCSIFRLGNSGRTGLLFHQCSKLGFHSAHDDGLFCARHFGFALIDILNRNDKIKFQLSPIYVALVAFCFSMTIGVLWEFF